MSTSGYFPHSDSYAYNHYNNNQQTKTMGLVKRQQGDRRWGMPVELPLTDCGGAYVLHDRRGDADRRKSPASLEDLFILFSQLPSGDPGQTN